MRKLILTGKGWFVEIICVDKIDSTHLFMCKKARKNEIKNNFALYALEQTNGVGSRDNSWQSSKGNLHLSFCLKREDLADDMPMASMSIYFAFILKELLASKGSNLWLKYPNDLYVADKKIGGVMSAKIDDFVVISVGLNLISSPFKAGILDISVNLEDLIKKYLKEIEKKILWKDILSKYIVEFEKSKTYTFHYNGKEVPLKSVLLCDDGSILFQNKRIYSLR